MDGVLDKPTLVLNRYWTPVHVTSVRQAIVLVFTGRAQAVCPLTYAPHSFEDWITRSVSNGNPRVRAVHFEIEAPEVIVLHLYRRLPPLGVVFNRRNLFRRDRQTCQYCGAKPGGDGLTIDHVIPLSRGGETTWENCVSACHHCNGRKGNRTPREADIRLRRPPTRPRWSPRYAAYARRSRPSSWDNFITQTTR